MAAENPDYEALAARQTLTLVALRQFVGAARHDFNNLLSVLTNGALLVPPGETLSPALRQNLDLIARAAARAVGLVEALKPFARRRPQMPAPADPADLLRRLRPDLARLAGPGVEVALTAGGGLPRLHEDPEWLEEILLLLACAACDGPAPPRRVELAADGRVLSDCPDPAWEGFRPGPHVRLTLRAEPGEAADPPRLPLGAVAWWAAPGELPELRLALAGHMVRRCQGHLTAAPRPDGGLQATAYLPADDHWTPPGPAAARAAPAAASTWTVLLVSEEPAIRQVIQLLLAREGHRVHVTGPADAVGLAHGLAGPLHLLVADTDLTGGRCADLARAVLARHPGTGVLFLSAYADAEVEELCRTLPRAELVPKPVHPVELAAAAGRLAQGAG